jgi:hypothetical protein
LEAKFYITRRTRTPCQSRHRASRCGVDADGAARGDVTHEYRNQDEQSCHGGESGGFAQLDLSIAELLL